MYFDSFADLLQMGKHGFYVWTAYGTTALVLVASWLARGALWPPPDVCVSSGTCPADTPTGNSMKATLNPKRKQRLCWRYFCCWWPAGSPRCDSDLGENMNISPACRCGRG